jgi:hypothetical protein
VGIVGIPDGYLLDLTDPAQPRLLVVEVELRGHDLFQHITEQLVRFAAGYERDQLAVRNFLHEEIKASKIARVRLEAAQKRSLFPNVDALLNAAVFRQFQGLVIIDERSDDLDQVLKQFACSISALEVKIWRADDGTFLYEFETLYEEEEIPLPAVTASRSKVYSPEKRAAMRARRAQCDTVVVPARAEGFKEVFLGENRWYEIRISPGMRDRIKYIAVYQVAPVSGITHIAYVKEIKPHGRGGKFELIFTGPAQLIPKIAAKNTKFAPYGPVYARRTDLLKARYLEEALSAESS